MRAAALGLALLGCGSNAALAARGTPDCFGYTWADQCSGCDSEIPPFRPGAETYSGVTEVVGPIDLPFLFRWYGRPIDRIWTAPSGYVTFSDQGPNVGERQGFPDPTPPNDMLAVIWLEPVDADITVESSPEYVHVQWTIRWVTDPTRPWQVHLLLFPDGSYRMHWPTTWGQLYATVGHEDAGGACGRLLFEGDPDTFETYEDEGSFPTPAGGDHAACISPPTLLDCQAPTPLRCGDALVDSLPGGNPSPTSAYGCDPGEWAATERSFSLEVDRLADVRVDVLPAAGQQLALFHPEDCNEWTCSRTGASFVTVEGVTPGDRPIVVVDGADALTDLGDFTLEVTCFPLAQELSCGETRSGTTAGGSLRLEESACLTGDLSGAETYFEIELAGRSNLTLDLETATGQSLLVFDADLPLEPANCLTGGGTTAWLPDPGPGRYIVVVDGPAGSEGAFELSASCTPSLSCDAAPLLGCNETVTGSTLSGTASVEAYGCRQTAYPGPERVHLFDQPVDGVVTFRLDDGAEPGLDLLLLDACNEQACLAVADSELSIELPAGRYQLVVDGPVGGVDYELSALCGQGITPDFISVSRDEGECFTERKTVWMTPEVPALDLLFSIDLTGSMIPERAQLPANIVDVIERLPTMLPDVAFGLVSHRDYHYPCLGWAYEPCQYVPSDFGQEGDWPYRLHHPMTKALDDVVEAATRLPPADLGGTSGEAYNRVMYEAVNDPAVGWRPGAQRMLVTFGDDVPHDCDLAACLGGPPMQRGIDLGPDGLPDTGDELATLDVLQGLVDNGTILLHLDSSDGQAILGVPYLQMWNCWAEQTGGSAAAINDDGTLPPGVDLAQLIADLVERRQTCDRLELVASPGHEEWLVDSGLVHSGVELPATVGFDIEICVPPGTPAGTHEFQVQALCAGELVAAQRVVVEVGACGSVVDPPPPDPTVCPGEAATLDAIGVTLSPCAGEVEYAWSEDGNPAASGSTASVSPATTTTYDLAVSCSTDPACGYLDEVVVTVLDDVPDGVYATLRASHEGDEATFHWAAARALLPGEHFHLLKAWDHPANDFERVNPEGDLSRSFTESDVSSWLQFFDLRVATSCEVQSEDEYPPTWP